MCIILKAAQKLFLSLLLINSGDFKTSFVGEGHNSYSETESHKVYRQLLP